MVSCYLCMRKLPDECICNDSFKSKKLRFIRNAMRELEIIEKICLDNWKPRILIDGEFVDGKDIEVSEADYGVEISVKIPIDKKGQIEVILFDTHDEPLYRHVLEIKEDIIRVVGEDIETEIVEGVDFHLSWHLGWRESYKPREWQIHI